MSVKEASELVYTSDAGEEPEDSYGRCSECGIGWLVLNDEKYAVDATCTHCKRSEQVHCCDYCAYGYAGPLDYGADSFPPLPVDE